MKHIFKNTFTVVLLLLAATSYSQSNTKVLLDKQYPAKSKSLKLENSFGNIVVSSWNSQEYSVQVELITEGFSEKEYQKLLSKLEIEESESSSEVKVSTSWDNQNFSTNGKKSYEVNYTVKTPKDAKLDIENSFGNVSTPDLTGMLTLDAEYGNITLGKLAKADIKLSFGNGTIEEIASGEVEAKYAGKLTIEAVGDIDLEAGFSQLKINKANKIDLEGKYGEIEIKEINYLKGTLGFSGCEIKTLHKSLDLDVRYVSGKLDVEYVSPGFEKINIESKFSKVALTFDPKCEFNFHTEHKFGELQKSSDFKLYSSVEEDFSSEFKGYLGTKSSDQKVYVSTSYGDAELEVD